MTTKVAPAIAGAKGICSFNFTFLKIIYKIPIIAPNTKEIYMVRIVSSHPRKNPINAMSLISPPPMPQKASIVKTTPPIKKPKMEFFTDTLLKSHKLNKMIKTNPIIIGS